MADDTLYQEPLPVISRAEAKSAGLDRYFTGETCRNGHVSERFVLNGMCVSCNKMYTDTRAALKRAAKEAARAARQECVSQRIISRAEAKAAGQVRYFTGIACPNGHVAERLTSNGGCVICGKARYDNWRAENPDKANASSLAHYHANPEKMKAKNKAIYAADPEFWKQRAKNWRRDNPDKAKEMDANSRVKNADRIKEYRKAHWAAICQDPDAKKRYQERVKAWNAANPGWRSVYRNRRRAREREAEGFYTANDIFRIHKAQRGRCACCRHKVGNDYHVDHIIPLAKGGSNWPKNLQITCPPCNQSKQARDPIDFMQSRGLLL